MKKLLTLVALVAFTFQQLSGAIHFFDDFNSYEDGNLAGVTQDAVGQGPWRQTGTVATAPIQVNNGKVLLGTSGQDVYAPLNSPISLTEGATFYIGLTLDVTSAQATGDYFIHFTPTAGNTSIFNERLFVRSAGDGFAFGYNGSSGGSVNYSSTELSFDTPYRLVLAYTVVSGALNDTFALYVNPADEAVESNNTPYMTSGYQGTGAESSTVAAINLRQGTAANAPALSVDNLVVSTTFAEAAPIPEPSALALLALGGLVCFGALRRKS